MQRAQKIAIITAVITTIVLVVGCTTPGPDAAEVASKYTEQTALAIIDGTWKLAGAIFFGLVLNGMLAS